MQVLHQVVHTNADVGRSQEQRMRGRAIRRLVVRKRKDRRAHQHGGGMLAGLLHCKRRRDHGGPAVPAAHHAGHETGAVMHVQAGDGFIAFQRPEIVDEEIVGIGPERGRRILAGRTALRCGPRKGQRLHAGLYLYAQRLRNAREGLLPHLGRGGQLVGHMLDHDGIGIQAHLQRLAGRLRLLRMALQVDALQRPLLLQGERGAQAHAHRHDGGGWPGGPDGYKRALGKS